MGEVETSRPVQLSPASTPRLPGTHLSCPDHQRHSLHGGPALQSAKVVKLVFWCEGVTSVGQVDREDPMAMEHVEIFNHTFFWDTRIRKISTLQPQ